MKVFLSWSGSVSHQVAEALRDWLPSVLQMVTPFVSSETEKGSTWLSELAAQITEADFGVVCVTRSNVDSPWLNFEAGALAKRLTERTRVAPLLFRMTPTELTGPLVNFQATTTERDDVKRLVRTMNDAAEGLATDRLDAAFDKWWPDLDAMLASLADEESTPPERSPGDVLGEILEHVRSLSRRLPSPAQPTTTGYEGYTAYTPGEPGYGYGPSTR